MMKKTWPIVCLILLLTSFGAHSEALRPGPWRFELKTVNGIIPFVIVFKNTKKRFSATLKNGKETIPLKIEFKRRRIEIPLLTYETSLIMDRPKMGQMTGLLVRHNKNPKIETPVFAVHGVAERFPEITTKPLIDLNGRWAVKMTEDDDKVNPGIIVFEQKGTKINGSILTPTGDYRYFEGYVKGQDFEAASFDGGYNYLLKGKVIDGKLDARILSSWVTRIEGKKDPKAELPDAYKQTQVTSLNFAFPNLKGKFYSLKSKEFINKPVIIQFFGTWCPNCLDEMNYLIPWYHKNKKRGIEIIALAFERSLGEEEAKIQLLKYQKKVKVPYQVLIAGHTSQDKPMEKIPGLKNFISFPTTVFLNRKHEVVKVHAGFNGPGTGEFYETWKSEFNQTVDELLK